MIIKFTRFVAFRTNFVLFYIESLKKVYKWKYFVDVNF